MTTELSWVRLFRALNVSSRRLLLTATHCMSPLPSRISGKTILPDLRKLYSQPWIRTRSPTCRLASWMLISTAAPGCGSSSFCSVALPSSSSLISVLLSRPLPVWLLRSDAPYQLVRAIQAGGDTDSVVIRATPSPFPNLSFLCRGRDENPRLHRCHECVSSESDPSCARIDPLCRGTYEHVRCQSSSPD